MDDQIFFANQELEEAAINVSAKLRRGGSTGGASDQHPAPSKSFMALPGCSRKTQLSPFSDKHSWNFWSEKRGGAGGARWGLGEHRAGDLGVPAQPGSSRRKFQQKIPAHLPQSQLEHDTASSGN